MIRKKRRKKSNNSILLIVIIIFVLIVGITIGYSTFNGYLFADDFVVAVRPAVSLLPTVVVTSGNGTYNSPYQIALP